MLQDAITITIDPAFNGPPSSANGGYACGRLAAVAGAHLSGPVAVSLHLPVPVGVPLDYRPAGRRGHAFHGEEIVASVTAANDEIPVLEPVRPEEAAVAQEAFDGTGHPFPGCFACGTERAGDGLGLRPGRVPGREGTVACLWSPGPELAGPDAVVPAEIVWSALDCPGGWTGDPVQRPQLLGRMTASVEELPVAGRSYVVVARQERAEGRTSTNTTALCTPEGRILARASALWIAVDPAAS